MNRQLGASYSVQGYLLALLIAAGAASAATNIYLAYHRQLVVQISMHSNAVHPRHAHPPQTEQL